MPRGDVRGVRTFLVIPICNLIYLSNRIASSSPMMTRHKLHWQVYYLRMKNGQMHFLKTKVVAGDGWPLGLSPLSNLHSPPTVSPLVLFASYLLLN